MSGAKIISRSIYDICKALGRRWQRLSRAVLEYIFDGKEYISDDEKLVELFNKYKQKRENKVNSLLGKKYNKQTKPKQIKKNKAINSQTGQDFDKIWNRYLEVCTEYSLKRPDLAGVVDIWLRTKAYTQYIEILKIGGTDEGVREYLTNYISKDTPRSWYYTYLDKQLIEYKNILLLKQKTHG